MRLLSLLLLLAAAVPVSATTIVVNTLADTVDPWDNQCSLREAIVSANQNDRSGVGSGECAAGATGTDLILITATGTIVLNDDLPVISGAVTLDGPGRDLLTIDGGLAHRLVVIRTSVAAYTIRDLTLTRGLSPESGGGINFGDGSSTSSSPSLTVEDVSITDCTALGMGGGIATFLFNEDGADIQLALSRVQILDNRSVGENGGGGIRTGSGVSLSVTSSLIAGNEADGKGGGIWMNAQSAPSSLVLLRSTVSGNAADGGGGLYLQDITTTVSHSAIVSNEASYGGGVGLANSGDEDGVLLLTNTVVADNTTTDGDARTDIALVAPTAWTLQSFGANLIGNHSDVEDAFSAGLPNADGDFVGTAAEPIDPRLAPLADNGGPTETRLPRDDSPVIDAGSCPGEPFDARGVDNGSGARAVARLGYYTWDDGCDIGPVEHAEAAYVLAGTYEIRGEGAPFASVRQAVDFLEANGISDDVTFHLPDLPVTQQVTIGAFPRTGGAVESWVTFEREREVGPGSGLKTVWKAPAGSEDSNWVVRLDGARHVRFRRIQFEAAAPGGWGRLLVLTGQAQDIEVSDCQFLGADGPPSDVRSMIFREGTGDHSGLTVSASTFLGGFRAVDYPLGQTISQRIVVQGSVFQDQTGAALGLKAVEDAVIEGNEITNAEPGATGIDLKAPRLGGATRVGRIEGNTIDLRGAESLGIVLREASGIAGEAFRVVNNFIGVNGVGVESRDEANERVHYLHNTIRAGGPALALLTSGVLTRVVGNILVSTGAEPPLVVDVAAHIALADYNALTAGTGPLVRWEGTEVTSLEAYHAVSGHGIHSTDAPVTFADVGAGDLHLAGDSDGDARLVATPLGEVPVDIDGDLRSPTAPYMGADEAPTPLDVPPPDPTTSIVIDGVRGVRYLGPPAEGVTVDDLAAQNLVRGVPGYYPTNASPTLWTEYDAVAGTWLATHGTGYELPLARAFRWYFLDRDGVGDPAISQSVALPFTLSTPLAPNDRQVRLELDTSGNRFNHLANPFGVPIDLSDIRNWQGGLGLSPNSDVYTYDDATGSWGAATSAEPWEAFRFRVKGPRRNGNPRNLTIPVSAQAPLAGRTTAPSRPQLAFALAATSETGRPLADRMLTVAFDGASAGFDMDEDIEKFQPPTTAYALIGARADGGILGHDARPFADAEIPLAIEARGARAEMTLSWDARTLPTGLPVVLVDLATGEEIDVRSRSEVTFRQSASPALGEIPLADLADGSAATDRFVLRIGSALAPADAVTALTLAPPAPNPSRGGATLRVGLPEAGPVRLAVFDVRGREVAVLLDGALGAGWHGARLPAGLAAGVYVVRLAAGGAVVTQRAVVVR